VLPVNELRHRVHVEEANLTAEENFKLLDKQNTDLTAREWVVVRESKSKDAKCAHFVPLSAMLL